MESKRLKLDNCWAIWEALLIFILIIVVRFIIPVEKFALLDPLKNIISPHNPLVGLLFWDVFLRACFFVIFIYFIVKKKYGMGWQAVGLREDEKKRWFTMGLRQGIQIFLLVTIAGVIISLFYPIKVEPQLVAKIIGTALEPQELLIIFLVTSFLAPFSEELYFRGFLYPALEFRMGRIPAMILASAIFGIVHFDLIRFIPITLGGIWLTYLYEKTGSLYTSITAHAVWNAISTILILQLPGIV